MKLGEQLKNKKYVIPGLLLGVALLGAGSVAQAFGGNFDISKLTGFTDSQKAVIQEANQIRQDAEEKAQKLLTDNGIDKEKLHEAMRTVHEENRKAFETAIENNDYAAFKTAVEGSQMATDITEEKFAKLVEAHKLREAGDNEGAREIMEELGLKMGKGMHGGFGGPRGGQSSTSQ